MKALVTGGGGFLGGAIVRLLRQRGDEVWSFTRTAYPWLDGFGVGQVHGDLADGPSVTRAAAGMDVIFHVAAKAGVWGRYADYVATNVTGTANVIAAAREVGVGKLVYTSTPSVVHAGHDIEGGNESLPYPKRFESYYPETKAEAEQLVLAAASPDLQTIALRPHLIWGVGDPHLIPRILARARDGTLRRLGTRPVRVDVTHVENAAHAHILAVNSLKPASPSVGKAYFISDGKPVDLWDFIGRILAEAGLPPVTRTVSVWKANLAGSMLERAYRLFGLSGEPAMTRFIASQLSTSHWYDISAARRDLGYTPNLSTEEGLRLLGEELRKSK